MSADHALGVASGRRGALWAATSMNVALALIELGVGLFANSLGLVADAAHTAIDALSLGLSLGALSLAGRPATQERSFGYHRATVLAALANAAVTLAVAVLIAIEGVARLSTTPAVNAPLVLPVALVGLVLNGVASYLLMAQAGEDLNMRSAIVHLMGDALASAGVALAAVVIMVSSEGYWADPVASILIAVMIGIQSLRLIREVVDVLLESSPRNLDMGALVSFVESVPGVESVHDVHAWSLSSEVHALSAHLVLSGHPSLEEAQLVGGRVKAALAAPYRIAHATLELECEACLDADAPQCAIGVPPLPGHGHGH